MNKRGLGRGLGALLSATPTAEDVLVDVPVDQIDVNPNQPRKDFDFKSLAELAASIKASGVIQPVIVRRQAGGYQLIAGERRWRAARRASRADPPPHRHRAKAPPKSPGPPRNAAVGRRFSLWSVTAHPR